MPTIQEVLAQPIPAEQVVEKTINAADDANRNKKLIFFKIRPGEQHGVVVELSSDIDFRSQFSEPGPHAFTVGGVACAKAKVVSLSTGRRISFNNSDQLFPNSQANFNMLLADGLARGVRFTFDTPMSNETRKQWRDEFRNMIREIYLEHIKSIELAVEITIKPTERRTL